MTARHRKDLRARVRALRTQHHALAREYSEVKERVTEYTERRFLSQGEELECKTLQRIKLRKKDELEQLTRELQRLEEGLVTSGVKVL